LFAELVVNKSNHWFNCRR